MKLVILIVSIGIGMGIATQAALSGQSTTIPRRVAVLEAKVRTLTGAVAAMLPEVQRFQSCEKQAIPVSQYNGYVFSPDGQNLGFTTAIDVTVKGQTPQAWVVVLDPSCVTPTMFRTAKLAPAARR